MMHKVHVHHIPINHNGANGQRVIMITNVIRYNMAGIALINFSPNHNLDIINHSAILWIITPQPNNLVNPPDDGPKFNDNAKPTVPTKYMNTKRNASVRLREHDLYKMNNMINDPKYNCIIITAAN